MSEAVPPPPRRVCVVVVCTTRAQQAAQALKTWFQFSSCTCDIIVEQSEQFLGSTGTRTLFSIELTTGRARVISMFSLVPSEAEVLLPPNSRFKVLGQLDAGNGLVIVQLKELPSMDPIIEFDSMLLVSAAAPATPAPPPKPLTLSSKAVSAAPASAPVAAVSSANWPSLLQNLQGALAPKAVAPFKYYRDTAFAAACCSECSDTEAAAQKLADAALIAAASKSLHAIVAGQGSPTSADTLGTLFAQARLAVPEIEVSESAATKAKDYSKAALLQAMRNPSGISCPKLTFCCKSSQRGRSTLHCKGSACPCSALPPSFFPRSGFCATLCCATGGCIMQTEITGIPILSKARFRSCAATHPPAGGTVSS